MEGRRLFAGSHRLGSGMAFALGTAALTGGDSRVREWSVTGGCILRGWWIREREDRVFDLRTAVLFLVILWPLFEPRGW